MKKFAITIYTAVLLVGCASDESLLSKKQECFDYRSGLEEEHNSDYLGSDLATSTTIMKVFYSPKQDSCLYVMETSSRNTNDPGANGSMEALGLYDHLTGDRLYLAEGCDGELHCGFSTQEARNKFYEELKKYE